jgi:hypothetical protein
MNVGIRVNIISATRKGLNRVTSLVQLAQTTEEPLIVEFFRQSEGQWRSERRYYTLPDGKTEEITSYITVRFLEEGSPELSHLANLHNLPDFRRLTCGTEVKWDSEDAVTGRRKSRGSTLFGALETTLYRDRGFATLQPITAEFYFPNPNTLCLRTEYNGSVFEEELKLIGQHYRTRQTIISRAGEQQMIGQYLEKRLYD